MFQPKRYSSSFQYSHSVVMPNEPKIPESEVISMPMRPQIEQEQLNKEHKKKYKPAEKLKLKLYKNMKKMKKERLDTRYRGTGNHTNHHQNCQQFMRVKQSMENILNLF